MVRAIPPKTSTGRSRAKSSGKRKSVSRGLDIKIKTGQGNKVTREKKEKVEPIRSWTFASKPKFTRYSETDKHVLVERIKEPAVRILEDITEAVLVAYLPGVNEKDIHIELHGDILEISARAKDEFGIKKYAKEILLPFMADATATNSSFKNGILEIKLREKTEIATNRLR